jgi:hypothetical protein
MSAFEQFVAERQDLIGNRLQKARPRIRVQLAKRMEGGPRQRTRALHLGVAR